MADVATPSAIDMAVGGNTSEAPKQKARPEKPDEEQYKADLAEAEKNHAKTMEKFVCIYETRHLARDSLKFWYVYS